MLSAISALYRIMTLIPQLKALWDGAVAMYVSNQLEAMHEADKAAITKAVGAQDQRDLETQLGSGRSGLASGIDGAVIVSTLPGVHK